MSAYIYLVKVRILINLAYRFDVIVAVIVNIITLLSIVFFWKAAYLNSGTVAGINENQMMTYVIISSSMGSIFSCNVTGVVLSRIREGTISIDLFKPISLYGTYFMQDIGESASSVLTKLIPMLAFSSILIQLPLPANTAALLLFLPSCLLSYGILWLLSGLTSLTAFKFSELGDFGMLKDMFIRLLSGSIIPLWFFPGFIQKISQYLPFQYTYQTALGIYIGKIEPAQALPAMALQTVWLVVLFILFAIAWNKAKKTLMVQGG